MGGPSSGRRDGKRCTDIAPALDVRQLVRARLLTDGARLRIDGAAASVQPGAIMFDSGDVIQLAALPMPAGGERALFLCPRCSGRAVLLYRDGAGFACRTCADLRHRSQREEPPARALRRVARLRQRLGWPGGALAGEGGRPAGMAAKTFTKLTAQHRAAVREMVMFAAARFKS